MRLILGLLVCLSFVPLSALGQERIRKVMVGPHDDQTRIVIAFIEPAQASYKMQSMIIDLSSVKTRKELPSSFQVDLTSTIRSLATGEKTQKILLLRWKKTGEVELKCDGKWVKQDNKPELETIVEATKAVIQNLPVETKTPIDATLSQDVEQKVSSILNALDTENFQCLRSLN